MPPYIHIIEACKNVTKQTFERLIIFDALSTSPVLGQRICLTKS